MARALTVDQAAEFLQVSPYTVRQWLRTRKIPGRKIGRVYRILDTDLEALVGAGAVREKAAAGYTVDEAETTALGKPRKLAGYGSLAHVEGLSVESYLKAKREEQQRENQP